MTETEELLADSLFAVYSRLQLRVEGQPSLLSPDEATTKLKTMGPDQRRTFIPATLERCCPDNERLYLGFAGWLQELIEG